MAVSQAPVVSEASAAVVPPVGGATVAALPSAVQDLTRFFLSLAGSSSLGAFGGVAGVAVPASGVGAQLCPLAPGGGAVASCAATAAPAVVVDSPAASAAVPEAGRSPIVHLLVLLKMTDPSLLLPFLDMCLEVLLAILAPLRLATACLVLAAAVFRSSGAVSLRV